LWRIVLRPADISLAAITATSVAGLFHDRRDDEPQQARRRLRRALVAQRTE
jgi:hypothetical protein